MIPQTDPMITQLAQTVVTRSTALDAAYFLTDACARLPGVDAAAVLVPDAAGLRSPVAATDQRLFDAFHALRAGHDLEEAAAEVMAYADFGVQAEQWPRLAQFAAACGVLAVYTAPVEAFSAVVGTLVLLCRRETVLAAEQIDIAWCCARIAAAGMVADAVADALPDAAVRLTQHGVRQHQITVWQATGALAARRGVDIPTALGMLRRHSWDHSQPLVHSARQVLAWTPNVREGFTHQDPT